MLHRLLILDSLAALVLLCAGFAFWLPGDQPRGAWAIGALFVVLAMAAAIPLVAIGLHGLGLGLVGWVQTGSWP